MKLRQLIEDEDAVSPVIGVILMVAITVILAAVIGTFVLGLGDQVQNTAPSASFTFDFTEEVDDVDDCVLSSTTAGSEGDLSITHDGGDKIDPARLDVGDTSGNSVNYETNCGITSDVSAGTTIAVETTSGETVRVTWSASGGGKSATLGKWTGPDA